MISFNVRYVSRSLPILCAITTTRRARCAARFANPVMPMLASWNHITRALSHGGRPAKSGCGGCTAMLSVSTPTCKAAPEFYTNARLRLLTPWGRSERGNPRDVKHTQSCLTIPGTGGLWTCLHPRVPVQGVRGPRRFLPRQGVGFVVVFAIASRVWFLY